MLVLRGAVAQSSCIHLQVMLYIPGLGRWHTRQCELRRHRSHSNNLQIKLGIIQTTTSLAQDLPQNCGATGNWKHINAAFFLPDSSAWPPTTCPLPQSRIGCGLDRPMFLTAANGSSANWPMGTWHV